MMAGTEAASPGNQPGMAAASDANAVYEGRYALDERGAVRLGFPGVTAHLRFQGSVLSMKADASSDDALFDLCVDGGPPTLLRLRKGDGTYPLFNGSAGVHTIELTRRNESWRGTCSILGYATGAGGALLAPAPLPGRRLMFIGDSVTCGELTAWRPGADPKDGVNSDARASYGMILARRLGAQCHLVSYGGRGLLRDWQGIRATNNAPQFYGLALPDDPTASWDSSRYVPDAVGIQLGTNDFSSGIPAREEFVAAYVDLIRRVRGDAPNALIFVMDSPIVRDDPAGGPKRTVLHGYLEAVVGKFGSPKVILAPLSHYPGVPNNGHPTGPEHVAMADELEPVLRRTLGW
jgi:hypothetical protein